MVSKKIALALAKKKSQRLLRVIVLLTCVLSVSSLFADEILVNPGFETGALSPWAQARSFTGPEDWNVTSADTHTGEFSATDIGNKELK